uniref:Uncharacterized protein n=1 Tax=Lepeophtheirus salmonis TaxID=72036 RepID=A0A0K2UWJ4_LEPSM
MYDDVNDSYYCIYIFLRFKLL